MTMKALKTKAALQVSAVALVLALGAIPETASACCVAYDYGNAQANTTEIETTFTTQLGITEADIIFALQMATGQLSGDLKQQTTAEANMNQTKDDREQVRRIQDATQKAMVGAMPGASSCNVVAGAMANQNTQAAVTGWREQVQQSLVNRDKGLDAGGNPVPQNVQLAQRQSNHCANGFGDNSEVQDGSCPNAASGANAGRDLKGSVLMNPSNTDGSGNVTDTHQTLSKTDITAATQFLDTALTAKPLGALPKDAAKTEAGRRLVAERNSSVARNSVAVAIGSELQSNRVPLDNQQVVGSGGSSSSLTDWSKAMAAQTLGYDQSNPFPNGVSKNAWLELRAKSWFLNPNWATNVDKNTDVGQTAKDLAMMEAFQVYQNWEQYHQLENIELSLATILAILENQNREKM
jgi:hypothetical protein